MKTTTPISKATRVFPLLVSLSFIVGCSDRLAPPTANSSTAERTVVFSWVDDPTKYPGQGSNMAMINARGHDRQELWGAGAGEILAMRGDRMIIATVDASNMTTLGYGSIDTHISRFGFLAGDPPGYYGTIDRGSVTISDNGRWAAWYRINSLDGTLSIEVYDLATLMEWSSFSTTLSSGIGIGIGTLPPPAFSPDGDFIAYADFDMNAGAFVLKVAPTNPAVNQPPRTIAGDLLGMGPGAIIDWNPKPGDDRILYASMNGFGLGGAIRIARADGPPGGDVVVLADDNEFAMSPSWAPDGITFAYLTQNNMTGRKKVQTVNTESKAAATLAEPRGMVLDLKWSEDGSHLLYTDGDGMMMSPDFTIPAGTLMSVDVASKNAIPLATHALKGFWVSE